MAFNYTDMDRYSNDGGKAFQTVLNSGSPMDSIVEKMKAWQEASKGLSPDLQKIGVLGIPGIFGAETIPWEGPGGQKERFSWQMDELKKAAQEKAEMNKKANEQSLLISSIGGLGKSLAVGLGGASWETLANQHANNLTAIGNIRPSTLQPLPAAQFQTRNFYS